MGRTKILILAAFFLFVGYALRHQVAFLIGAQEKPYIGFACGKNDPEARYARSLQSDQLAEIFATAQSLPPWPGDEKIPSTFQGLNAIALSRPLPGQVHIRLKACLDHHTDLVVYASDSNSENSINVGNPRIELHYGEGADQGKEILWSQ